MVEVFENTVSSLPTSPQVTDDIEKQTQLVTLLTMVSSVSNQITELKNYCSIQLVS